MGSIKWKYDDSEFRELLRNLKGGKKAYRECANDVLEDIKSNMEYVTHVDTGQMKSSYEVSPLKMRDGGYSVMGEITNSAQKPWQSEPYPSYEIARGGSHDAIAQGLELSEMQFGSSLEELLEGLLR